jgi:hypothetical protein
MPAPSGFDHVPTTKSNSTPSISAHPGVSPPWCFTGVSLDTIGGRALSWGHFGCFAVKQTHWFLVLLLFGTIVYASTVPPVDNPETAFNEIDAPVTLAPHSLIRINFRPSAWHSVTLPKVSLDCHGWVVNNSAHGLAAVPKQRCPGSLQKLLCTFLI